MEEIKLKLDDMSSTADGCDPEVIMLISSFADAVELYYNKRHESEITTDERQQELKDTMSLRAELLTDKILKMCYVNCCKKMKYYAMNGIAGESIASIVMRNTHRWVEVDVRNLVDEFEDQIIKIMKNASRKLTCNSDSENLISDLLIDNRNMAVALMAYKVSGLIRCN
jgi:hypothetical protein